MPKISDRVKGAIRSLLILDDKPYKIAAGAALGVFFGILPGGITVALAFSVLMRISKKATTVMVLATNTWTTIVLIPAFAWVGGSLFGINYLDLKRLYYDAATHGIGYFFENIIFLEIAVPIIWGMVIVSFVISLLVFLAAYAALQYYKHKINLEKK